MLELSARMILELSPRMNLLIGTVRNEFVIIGTVRNEFINWDCQK